MFLPSFKARSQSATVSGLGGSEGTKHEERFKRIHEAMIDVQNICKEAIEEEEKEKGNFVAALREYFHRIHKSTSLFKKSGLNKKRVMQFGLACTYLHRTGLAVDGVILFKKKKIFADKLPRTHSLMKKKIRVNSITRNETLLKILIRDSKKIGITTWKFPDF